MSVLTERIWIGTKGYRKFIPFGRPVTDGTCRCFSCGQIDEPAYHDDDLCPYMIFYNETRARRGLGQSATTSTCGMKPEGLNEPKSPAPPATQGG